MVQRNTNTGVALYLSGLLGWLVPGAGYMYLGQKTRGTIICIAICTTFFLGVLVGGVEMVGPQFSKAWFVAQVVAGLPAIISVVLQDPNVPAGYGKGIDLGQVYTGVAGLLNLLCVVDTLMRAHVMCQGSRSRQSEKVVTGRGSSGRAVGKKPSGR